MKNVLSYINRPLFGAEIKSWIAENTKQNTEYSRIARSMLRYMNLRADNRNICGGGRRPIGGVIVAERNEHKSARYQDGDIYLNPCFGDLWVVDGASFIKINNGYAIELDEPEGFIKVGHIDGVINKRSQPTK